MKKIIGLISLFLIIYFSAHCASQSKGNDSLKTKSKEKKEKIIDPRIFSVDSTVIALLEGKLISTQNLKRLSLVEKTIRAKDFLLPIDAIFIYGEKARGGVYITETIK